jgi:hypothetical protein
VQVLTANLLPIGFAEMRDAAFVALWTKGCASVSAVKNEPMMGVWNLFLCEMADEHLFHRKRSGAGIGHEPKPVTDAKDVCIDCHPCFAPNDTQHNIRGFASNSRKFSQLLQVLRHFSAILFP